LATLLFFGKLSDFAGAKTRSMEIAPSDSTVHDLINAIKDTDPILGDALDQASVRFVVNQEIVEKTMIVTQDDEIAFLPPVSGG